MKNKIIIMAILLFTVFSLAGCGQEDEGNDLGASYVGGKEALEFSFIDGQPPAEIFDGESMSFVVSLMLSNKGEHSMFEEGSDYAEDFDFGRLTLKGINPSYFGVTQEDLTLDFEEEEVVLMGYKKNPSDGQVLEGGVASVAFEPMTYMLDLQGNNEVPLFVDLCYNYRTRSTTNICIVSDVVNNNFDVCDPYSEKSTQNSAAPVHITKVVQAPYGNNKISLMIEIAQVNNKGIVYEKVDPNNPRDKVCNDMPSNQKKNKVNVKVYLADEANTNAIECTGPGFETSNEGTVNLFNGQPKTFVCNLDISDVEQDYVDQLYVDLEYAYGEQISKTLLVKDYQ